MQMSINLILVLFALPTVLGNGIFISHGIIDDFNEYDNSLYISLTEPVYIGSEIKMDSVDGRNISLVVTEGEQGAVMSCGVSNGEFNMAVGSNSQGYVILSYDVSISKNKSNGLRILVSSDHQTEFTISVSSDENKISKYTGHFPLALDQIIPVYVNFDDFIGNADFINIIWFQIMIMGGRNVDILIDSINYGTYKTLFLGNYDIKCISHHHTQDTSEKNTHWYFQDTDRSDQDITKKDTNWSVQETHWNDRDTDWSVQYKSADRENEWNDSWYLYTHPLVFLTAIYMI